MLSVRKNNIGKARIKPTAYWEEFICCHIRREENKLVPGRNRSVFFANKKYQFRFHDASLPFHGLPKQGAKKAESGPRGVQKQQTDLPSGCNMFPEGAIEF